MFNPLLFLEMFPAHSSISMACRRLKGRSTESFDETQLRPLPRETTWAVEIFDVFGGTHHHPGKTSLYQISIGTIGTHPSNDQFIPNWSLVPLWIFRKLIFGQLLGISWWRGTSLPNVADFIRNGGGTASPKWWSNLTTNTMSAETTRYGFTWIHSRNDWIQHLWQEKNVWKKWWIKQSNIV